MKKKNWIQIMIVTGALEILSGMSAHAEATSALDLETLFYTYSQGNMVFDYYGQDYLYATWETDDYAYDGFLALEQSDFNGDGEEELLAVRIKGGLKEINGYQENQNDVIAEIYQYQGDRLQRIAQHTIAEDVLCYNADRVDVFLVNSGAGSVLCCEKKETSSIFATGQEWSFTAVAFDGTQFTEVSSALVGGSGWTEEDEAQGWNALAAVGLYPSDIITTSVADQVGNISMVNRIRRYMITDYDTVNNFLNAGTEGSMQYGETYFYSYVNEGIQNKINGEFCSVPVAEESTAVDSEYIISDIDSRYLTETDLEGLTEWEILLARNEIYARHGRIFNNEELNAYFSSKSWYEPTVAGTDFTEEYAASVFNEYEVANIGFIVQYENANGLNQF